MGQKSEITASVLPPPRAVRWSLARKVSLALVSILLCTLLLSGFFAYYKFESVYSSLVQSRYSFVVYTIKKRVEDNLNLGLALRQLRQVQDLLEREKSRDPQLIALEVFDANGEVLFDTDRGAISSLATPELVDAIHAGTANPFSITDEDTLVLGLPLVNSLGKLEGGIILRYPMVYVTKGVSGLLLELSKQALQLLVIFALLAVGGLYLLFGRVGRRLIGMELTLDQALSQGVEPEYGASSDPLDEKFRDFVAKTREAVTHIHDATEDVEKLDRLQ